MLQLLSTVSPGILGAKTSGLRLWRKANYRLCSYGVPFMVLALGFMLRVEALAQPAGWLHSRGIIVTENSGVSVANYQLLLTLNTQDLVTAGQMNANGDDIRFGNDLNGSTLLNYWIESGMNTSNTKIWVKIPFLAANAATNIYLFYGNNSASAESNIDGTFIGPHSSTDSIAPGNSGGVTNSQRGFRFAPNEDILVKRFGKREPNGSTRYVTLFDFTSQAILRQHQVSGPAGQYVYSDLGSPIWLTQSTQYLLELYQGSSDGYYFGVSSQIGTHLTYYDMRYCNSCSQNTFPGSVLIGYQYGYPDFHYYTKNNVTPAPTYSICPAEVCNGIDDNCDGNIDEGLLTTYYRDMDNDGFGNPSNTTQACSLPGGYVTDNTDCNDNSAIEKPGQVWYKDTDNDGYAQTGASTLTQCARPVGYKVAAELTATTGDCNDSDGAINPGASEACDGIDNNCNVVIDEGVQTIYYRDFDNDGFGNPSSTISACSLPGGYVTNNTDCNDNSAIEKPGQVWYKDTDNDGYAQTGASTLTQCARPVGYKAEVELTATTGDCNDGNAAIKPGAAEICDGIDNNCNGSADEGVLTTFYRDMDNDGFGNPSNTTQACSLPGGYVTNNTDCNDNSAIEKPGQVWYKDADNDGYAQTGASALTQCARPVGYKVAAELTATTGDCNDGNAAIKPGAAEICDGIDNNCNGQVDESSAIGTPWISGGIGSGANGTAVQNCLGGNTTAYSLSAQGNSTSTGEVGHFVYQQICGNTASLTVRIATLGGGGWAGISMRESLAGGSRMVALKTQLSNMGIREVRSITNGPKQTQVFPATLQHEWLRLVRNGNTFQYYTSPNGVNWQLVGAVNTAMNSCLLVGMFVESINVNTTTTASFTNITISGGTTPTLANQVDSGFNSQAETLSFSVFPNPSSGEVDLDLTSYEGRAVRVEIFTLDSRLMQQYAIGKPQMVERLNLSALQKGMYLIKVTDSSDHSTAVQRIVIQ